MKFIFTWQGSRVPKAVTFPDGSTEQVSYMRDGICLFKSGISATYTRIDPNHSAEFTINETLDQIKKAIENYQALQ